MPKYFRSVLSRGFVGKAVELIRIRNVVKNEDLRRWKWLGNAVSFVDPRTHISTFRASPVALLRSLASLVAVAKSPVRATCIWF